MRIGLFGGTFDPIHWGHLVVAEAARESLGLQRLLVAPAALPPHKEGSGGAGPEDRLAMVRAALEGQDGLEPCDVEFQREGPSFTIETARLLQADLNPRDELLILTGLDAFLEIQTWREYQELLRLCPMGILTRPGAPVEALDRLPTDWIEPGRRPSSLAGLDEPILLSPADGPYRILLVPVPKIGLSSSLIRRRVAAGRSIRFLVPPVVESMIRSRGLYRIPPPSD